MKQYVIAIYIRLSLEDSKYESLSIENQRLVLHEYIAGMPEGADAEVLEFVDNGYTGTNFERPAVQRLIEMVKSNQIDCIIVKDFSRFGRNSIETGFFIERVFPLFHTRFVAVSDGFDSDAHKGDTGGLEVAFKYLINEQYSRDMSIKCKSAKYAKMRRGEYQSVTCIFGYRKGADGRLEPDPEEAPVIKLIFQMAADGLGFTDIAAELTKLGFPTPGEIKAAKGNKTFDVSRVHGRWNIGTVIRILDDERFLGTYIHGRYAVTEIGSTHYRKQARDKWHIIPNHHPAIIEQELFDKAHEKLHRFSIDEKKQREWPLRGKIYCGCCHHLLSYVPLKEPYYMCRHSLVDENSPCHGLKILTRDVLYTLYCTLIQQLNVADTLTEEGVAVIPQQNTAKDCFDDQIEQLMEDKRCLYEQLVVGEIDAEQYQTDKRAYDELLSKIKNARAAATARASDDAKAQEKRQQRKRIRDLLIAEGNISPEVIDLLIEKVLVYPEQWIEIEYKIRDLFE